MTDTTDVLVVGGGLVGASLAAALAGTALSVTVVEAAPIDSAAPPSFDWRHTALAPTTRRFLEALGLWGAVGPECAPIREIHVSDRGRFGFTRMNAAGEGLEALGWVVPNHVLGRALRPLIDRAENVAVHQPARVTDLHTDPQGVTALVPTEAGVRSVRARLLVVADGARSGTRDALGVGTRESPYGQAAVITNVRTERRHRGRAFERFTRDGPLAVLPAGDTSAVVWTVPAGRVEEIVALPDDAFLRELQRLFGQRLGRFLEVGRRHAYPLTALVADRFTAERAVLLGNAAHTLHPVAGQGFNLALRDVAVLAELLVETPRQAGDSAMLARYDRLRRPDYRRTLAFTDLLVRSFSNALPGVAGARNAALVALDLAPAGRRALMKRAMGRHGWLPRLARGLPLTGETT